MSQTTEPRDPEALRSTLEGLVLGAPARYDQDGFERASGIPIDRARRYWRALGFSDAEPGEAPYSDTDISALQRAIDLVEVGEIEERYVLALTRALGNTMARLADWQVDIAVDRLQAEGRPLLVDRAQQRLATSLPDLEHMLVHAWRRHLWAALERALEVGGDGSSSSDGAATELLTVGFADLVGFTAITRRLDEDELGELVEEFEAWAAETVITMGGRLVKTLGDEVLFAAPSVAVGVEAALRLATGLPEPFPRIRVGVATGPIVHRMGDLFGTPVNLASRLTTFAAPGSVWADAATAAAAAELDGVGATPTAARSVRGLGLIEPWVLSRITE